MTFETHTPTWIWYPGDFEIWLGNEMQNRRTERGAFFPPFWKMDAHYVLVEFSKKVDLACEEHIAIHVEGRYNVKIDGKLLSGAPTSVTLEPGQHTISIKVHNQANVPSIYIKGSTVVSDDSWLVTYEDKEWIDESGRASDTSTGTVYMAAGAWNLNDPQCPPSAYRLPTTTIPSVQSAEKAGGTLVDFGKNSFGYVSFIGLKGEGSAWLYYGESEEEALDTEYCETCDHITICPDANGNYTVPHSRACRYVYIVAGKGLEYSSVAMEYEYLPVELPGRFECDDALLNRIWEVSAYTMHLTTREFFIDGIKRDRWVWSGDAYQSYLMNYYLFFDNATVRRTMLTLRGKDPVTSHVNTIMDYTFYWFIAVDDYMRFTGDRAFVTQLYPRMRSLMDYCLGRRNANGMMEGLPGDWVFIDWADFGMSKNGEVSFEQLLFCRSLETLATCAAIANDDEGALKYGQLAAELRPKLFDAFWDEQRKAFVHNRENGEKSDQITPYTNIFALLFGYLDREKTESIRTNVLLNPDALKITTPYMRFYELEALCQLGEHEYVLNEMRDYWGGMLREGATTFWEKYNPRESGTQHLAMYGRPYGKSLCHAWGASPIYLLGRYYMGIEPLKEGYEEFVIRPRLGGLQWMRGSVPTPYGQIELEITPTTISVRTDGGYGYIYFDSPGATPSTNIGEIETVGDGQYRLKVEANETITITLISDTQ